jgi:hypothetical protein
VLRRRWLIAVLALTGLGMPALGQDTVELKWQFQKDKPFYQEMNTVTKQTMKIMGMDVTQNQDQTFFFSWTPKEQDKDKNWIITQKIEGVRMDMEMGGNKINFDSTRDTPGTGNPLADFFKQLVGSEFKLTLSPDMKVLKIEGREDFVNKLIKSNQQIEPLLKQILSDDALKQMADPAFAAVPNKPVKKGDTWEKVSKLDMGPIGTYDTTYKYTYEGKDPKDAKLDRIKVDTALSYKPPGPNASGALPFKIKDAKLTSKNAGGVILFDNTKHRQDSSEMKVTLEGTLDIDISGMTSNVSLSQEQTTKVKTTDTNPIKK